MKSLKNAPLSSRVSSTYKRFTCLSLFRLMSRSGRILLYSSLLYTLIEMSLRFSNFFIWFNIIGNWMSLRFNTVVQCGYDNSRFVLLWAGYRTATIDQAKSAMSKDCTLIITFFILISLGNVISRMQWICTCLC